MNEQEIEELRQRLHDALEEKVTIGDIICDFPGMIDAAVDIALEYIERERRIADGLKEDMVYDTKYSAD